MIASFLHQSILEAYKGRGCCAPNPAVGAIIVNSDNEIIATGYHQGPGLPHAEIDALKKVNFQAQGMTMYVTLEPCCHYGRTPPCTDALIQAGIKQVIYGYQDPNPIIRGNGAAILKKAGIACELIALPEINNFYKSYHHWQQTRKPFVTAKIAMSLDGVIAAKDGKPIPITGTELAEYTHYNRKNSDAILTTVVTIKNDDPKLNARHQNTIISKPLYILDTHLSLPLNAQIFQTAKSITVFHSEKALTSDQQALEKLGIHCIPVETDMNGLNLLKVIECIGNDGIHDLWIEAGGKCFSAFMRNDLLQRALIYIAPKWLGDGMRAFERSTTLANYCSGKKTIWKQMGKDGILELLCNSSDEE